MKQSASGTTTDTESAGHAPVRVITRRFSDLVRESLVEDPVLRAALHREALDAIRSGNSESGNTILQAYYHEEVPAE